jgi:4-amino-4-deoxy-L-arabinose transferase-like glycosyltransferase
MNPTAGTAARPRPRIALPSLRLPSLTPPRPELAGLLVVAAGLNLWALGRNGWANEYYSAAVRSMSSSWHDFLYGSFDSSGVMTVDKPPLALWVQALSVKLFGFHSLSVLVPQALMGVATVALVYDLTRRRFGRAAGFVAGLVLATTPIAVAISRHNNPDALLILCCVAALWCTVRALEDGRTRWLVLAGVAVGLGFEAKMAVALLVVPGLVAAWLWVAPRGRARALRQLLAAGGAMVAVGGAWPLLVALTPSSDRPWISGTSDNSILSLIFGYNGFGRIDGQAGGPAAGGGGPGGGGGSVLFGGSPGPLRLLDLGLGGQAGWLLGFAVVGGIGIVLASRLRRPDPRTGWLLAVGGAFLTTGVAFSAAKGIFHPYYVSLMAPFTAALVGGGARELAGGAFRAQVAAPLAVAAGVVTELVVLHDNPGQLTWLAPLLVVVGCVAAVALAARLAPRVRATILAVALGMLMIAPASWAAQTLGHATNGTFPAGGPPTAASGGGPGRGDAGLPGGAPPGGGQGGALGGGQGGAPGGGQGGTLGGLAGPRPGGAGGGGGFAPRGGAGGRGAPGGGAFGGNGRTLAQVVRYVQRHGGGTIATSSQSGAAAQIIDSGADVAGLGGFSGRESDVSVAWLAQMVRSGHIRWVLTGGQMGGLGGDARAGSREAMAAVAKTCRLIPSSAYASASSASSTGSSTTGHLYDCSGRADALLALA